MVPPNAALPAPPVPTDWSKAPDSPAAPGAEATPLAQWWQRFGDPQLTELVGQALQAHTSVRSAQAALQQARAQAQVQQAGLLPSVNASGSAQRSPQRPASQVGVAPAPEGHARSQPPQWAGSDWRSEQRVPQVVVPSGQEAWQE